MKIGVTACLLLAVLRCPADSDAATSFKHHPLVYNFYDMLAQSACAARVSGDFRVWAVRRSCPGAEKSCALICSHLSLSCFHAYHVYKNPAILEENEDSQPDGGVPGLSMFSYTSGCAFSHPDCGPNYCCCQGPYNALG